LLAAVAAMPQNPGIRWITRRDMTLVKPAPLKKPAAADVLSLKVTLRNTKPPIWRRILMPESMTLADLHLAIQTAMGWYSCHFMISTLTADGMAIRALGASDIGMIDPDISVVTPDCRHHLGIFFDR
jgi:hypothetical protein